MQSQSTTPRFNFDEWAELARSDPQAFESRRTNVLEAAICHALPARQRRLRGLQWQLDQIRHTSATPLAACIRMNRMLWDQVTCENGLLEWLTTVSSTRRS